MDNNIDFEDIIYDDLFLKNIKRMFIMKKMEQYDIKKINIEFDEITKSFKINIMKNKTDIYYIDYKIKRRKKKQKYKDNIKKRRLLDDENINKGNTKTYDNSSEYNIDNNINSPPCHISEQLDFINKDKEDKKNTITNINYDNKKVVSINKNKNIDKETSKSDYKNDELCEKLYRYIKLFIKVNNISNCKNNIYVKDILKEIEDIFKNYGMLKKIA
ncbi:hypothetical protein BC941DRAFT_27741 [Chlamydoabsidia padenii]|nr:hypothetical protein BC941DRAFT_198388 [Chlamydoabsidia padenii]KAI8337879.1 hypothetical protein BC941DRAFT_27741 [Chlamydoabsidia padenii]